MTDQAESDSVHRTLDPTAPDPAVQIVETVAELEGADPTELPTMYDCVDGILDNLFSEPPAPDAQMEIEFTYGPYRIAIDQDGAATFVKTE